MFLQCVSISRRMQYMIFNWRQLGENTADPSTLSFNSSRKVENQTMVLFWLLTGLKFWKFWYINHYVLKKKVFYLYRVWACDVMKSLQWNGAYTKKVYDGFWNFRTQANIFQWKIFSYHFWQIGLRYDQSIIQPCSGSSLQEVSFPLGYFLWEDSFFFWK